MDASSGFKKQNQEWNIKHASGFSNESVWDDAAPQHRAQAIRRLVVTCPLSVVMPVYNQERYLPAALQSILSQTYRDFELIIVDDGSTDGTRRILNEVNDGRVKVVTCVHAGLLAALQRGVTEARGEWVARMDSDDLCHPERLQRQMTFLVQHPECLFVGSAYGLVTPNDRFLVPTSSYDWCYITAADIPYHAVQFADSSVVFHRGHALGVGLYDPDFENEKPLWYRLLGQGRGAVLGDPLYFARWRLGSHSRSAFAERTRTKIEIRRRYDPRDALFRSTDNTPPSQKARAFEATIRCVQYYLLAGDRKAARQAAFLAWRQAPIRRVALVSLVKAISGRRSLRIWRPAAAHSRYHRADRTTIRLVHTSLPPLTPSAQQQ